MWTQHKILYELNKTLDLFTSCTVVLHDSLSMWTKQITIYNNLCTIWMAYKKNKQLKIYYINAIKM